MNKREYERFMNLNNSESVITINDLENKSDRTLLYGYTCDRATWHVYVKDNEIISVIYMYGENPEKVGIDCNHDYKPNKRLYPEKCDFEFCKLLSERGVDLTFTTWTDRVDIQTYYGKTL